MASQPAASFDSVEFNSFIMPRPLSVSQETIIIVLYYSVQSEMSAVQKPESPLVGSFFCTII